MLRRAIAWCTLWLLLAGGASAQGFTFAALGDTPYTRDEESAFVAMLGEMNREPLAFVIHVGDFKDAYTECTDALFLRRKEWFELSHHPFIFVPGDNEWIDCQRRAGGRYRPLERLARLREIFFTSPAALGQRHLPLARQSDGAGIHPYPEHARWIHDGVVFATLNVPGGDNNYTRDRKEFLARDAAVREWIREAFRIARDKRLGAVVLVMQANPWAAAGPRRSGYAPLLATITAETLAFDGEVLLIHGDTHRFRVDRPLRHPETRRPIENFTRLEVFGSPTVNWVRVRVERDGNRVRFEATPGS